MATITFALSGVREAIEEAQMCMCGRADHNYVFDPSYLKMCHAFPSLNRLCWFWVTAG